MVASFVVFSLLTTAAWAQSSTGNPLIPSGISPGCSSFLSELNSDSTLNTCTSSLIKATEAFGPDKNAAMASDSSVDSAIDTICSDATTNNCPESYFRGKLTDFYSSCSAELTTTPNDQVIKMYNVFYTMVPFRKAICSKNDNDSPCVKQAKKSGSLSLADIIPFLSMATPLKRRADSSIVALNSTTFSDSFIPFLFLRPDLDAATLCTPCTRQVFQAYTEFETLVSFAPGLDKSDLLKNQLPLYNAIQNTCGANFLQSNIQAAGGISGDSLFSGAVPAAGNFQWVMGLGMGIVTLAVAYLS